MCSSSVMIYKIHESYNTNVNLTVILMIPTATTGKYLRAKTHQVIHHYSVVNAYVSVNNSTSPFWKHVIELYIQLRVPFSSFVFRLQHRQTSFPMFSETPPISLTQISFTPHLVFPATCNRSCLDLDFVFSICSCLIVTNNSSITK